MERLGHQDQNITKDVVIEAFERWALQVLTFLARVQSLAEGFPFLPALHYFFQLNLNLAWHMRSRPAITIGCTNSIWKWLIRSSTKYISNLSCGINISLNAEHFICFWWISDSCSLIGSLLLWCFNEPFQKKPICWGTMNECVLREMVIWDNVVIIRQTVGADNWWIIASLEGLSSVA